MQNAIKASRPIPPPVTADIFRKSFNKALEMLEDSPTEGLVKSMCTVSGVTTEELFSDYKLLKAHHVNYLVMKPLIRFWLFRMMK